MEATAQASIPRIIPELVPEHVRRDIGLAAYQGTLEFMRVLEKDPERRRRADEELAAFKKRRAAQKTGG